MSVHTSVFDRQAEAYLRHHRAFGMRYRGVHSVLSLVSRYLQEHGAADLDQGSYEDWRASRYALHANTKRKAEQAVRRFCLFRLRQ